MKKTFSKTHLAHTGLRVPVIGLVVLIILLALTGCEPAEEQGGTDDFSGNSYGVFLSVTEDLKQLDAYDTIVIDAQYFSKEEIEDFRSCGHKVYSYINVGSLEDFRNYYVDYKDLTLGAYENWEEEYWIDVSDRRWQDFITGELAPSLLEKGIDGFFVDNCDVFYHYPTEQMLEGLSAVMNALVQTGKAVLINGGDTFLDAYCDNGGSWEEVITGINQETVFSRILWDGDKFGTAEEEDHKYFMDYIERYSSKGADIFLLEYTRDENLIAEIKDYCEQHGFHYYISDSVELD